MKFIVLIALLGFINISVAQGVTYLVTEGNVLRKNMKDGEALQKYMEALRLSPNDFSALVATSESYSIIGAREKDKRKQSEYFEAAKIYAGSALAVAKDSAQSHYVMALAAEKMASVSSGKERAAYMRDLKTQADSTIAISPDHVYATHLLGKWNMDISSKNVAEKAALKVLYGGLPSASLEVALLNFEKVRRLDPWFVANYLELAKAYKAAGKSDKSIEVLNRMIKLPPRTADDAALKAEGKKMLESLL
ncbi:hypothetical protein [Pollutibacter soli]|uniref:hypothetical protein n=1 Tax=Pollutibacter soli TaxID=3034157 RepID=UPI003013D55A